MGVSSLESNPESHKYYNARVQKVLAKGNASKMLKVEVYKALDCSRILLVTSSRPEAFDL